MYHIPQHLSAFPPTPPEQPIGLPLAPMAGYGALVLPANAFGQDEPKPLSTEAKVVLYGVGALLLAGIGYLFYKKMQVYEHIAKTEGSEGALKLAAGEAAIGVASDWLRPRRSEYNANLKRKRKRMRRRS